MNKKFLFAPALIAFGSLVLVAEDKVNPEWAPLDPAKTAAVDAALPSEAPAKPKAPRRLLISARTEGFYHKSIPLAAYAIEALGRKTGAYTAVVDREMSAFDAANLDKYDAVLFLSTTKLKFEKAEHRQALLDYIRVKGRGIAGIHAATDNFYDWPEGQALMGGVFHSHPWTAGDTVAVRLDEPTHPLVRPFGGQGFWVKDEIYQIVGPYGRDKQRVVLSLDMSKAENQRPPEKLVRKDGDFPIAWAKQEGTGRLFYSSLGHNDEIFQDRVILSHFLAGLQFALGDLEAPAVPIPLDASKAALAPSVPSLANAGEVEARQLLTIAAGDEPRLVRSLEVYLRKASEAQRKTFFSALKADEAASPAARRIIANLIVSFGGDTQIPILEKWSVGPQASQDAIQALGLLGTPAAGEALARLLAAGEPSTRVALLNAAGTGRAVATVPALVKDASSADAGVAEAAVDALGRIGNGAALQALTTLAEKQPTPAVWRNLVSAAQLAVDAKAPARVSALKLALAPSAKAGAEIELSALEALLALAPEETVAPALSRLAQAPFSGRLTRATVVAASLSSKSAKALEQAAPALPASEQLRVLQISEQLGRHELYPVAVSLASSADGEVKAAALQAIASTATTVAETAPLWSALEVADTRAAALQALSRARASGLDAEVVKRANAVAEPAKLVPLLTIASNRADPAIMPLVLKSVRAEQADLRGAAFRALAPLVRGQDLDTLFELRAQLKTAAERRAWQDATVNAIRFRTDTDAVVALLAGKLPSSTGFETSTYVVALANLNQPAGVEALRQELASGDLERRKEVIRALSTARVPASGALLIGAAEAAKDASERILALRGFLDYLLANPELPIEERVSSYKRAWAVAERREEQGAIIAIVPSLWNPEGRRFGEEITAKYRAATP